MPSTINEQHLLDLLESCLDLMHYGKNGEYGAEEIARVEMVLRLAGRSVPKYDDYGHRTGEFA
jgi:hypothetical protein